MVTLLALIGFAGLSTLPNVGLGAASVKNFPRDVLPPTPQLPLPIVPALPRKDRTLQWMQVYQPQKAALDRVPILLIHGGLGSTAYFGSVLQLLLEAGRTVVATDLRGHGRSTMQADDVFSFETYARDTHQALLQRGVSGPCDWVGWSDGGTTTLAALQDAAIARGIRSAFVFGASMNPDDTDPSWADTALFNALVERVAAEHAVLQPDVDFHLFARKVQLLESSQPQYEAADLGRLPGAKVAIVEADHDGVVKVGTGRKLHAAIPGSKLIVLEDAGHFAPMQKPAQFAGAVLDHVRWVEGMS